MAGSILVPPAAVQLGISQLRLTRIEETTVNALSPARQFLAKWRFDGFNPTSVVIKQGITILVASIMADLRVTAGVGSVRLAFADSNDDVTYGDDIAVSSANTSFIGQGSNMTPNFILNAPALSSGFLAVYAQVTVAGEIGKVKNISFLASIQKPPGVTVTRVI